MHEQSALEKQLRKMLDDQDFNGLDAHKIPSEWTKLSQDERRLLGLLFVAQGEQYLLQGDQRMHESLEIAAQVAHDSAEVFYNQALAYAIREDSPRCLAAACKALQAAVKFDPDHFKAWLAWATTLMHMAEVQSDQSFLNDAHHKFVKAEKCAKDLSVLCRHSFLWQWAKCWHASGKNSGEAHDYYLALEKYRAASELNAENSDFWDDYGTAVAALGALINRKELLVEATEIYRKGLKTDNDHFSLLLNLGTALQRLYEVEGEETYFQLANETLARCAEIKSNDVNLWHRWGQLFADSGKFKGNLEHLQIGSEKFSRANACEMNHPEVLSSWAESQMLCGAHTERLDLLRQAEEKIIRSLELSSDNSNAWEIYGSCLTEIGRYFANETYYLQAIEKFRYGLTLNAKHARLWYGLSLAHFALGELRGDPEMIEQSTQYCAKVMESSGGVQIPQFCNDWGVALMRLAELTGDQNALEAAIEKFELAVGGKEITEQQLQACDVEWIYNYGCAYDFLGEFTGDFQYHEKAVNILTQLVQHQPEYVHARYNLALAWSNLGELNDDIDAYHKAIEHFYVLLGQEVEDEAIWNDCGVALLHLGQLVHDPIHPEQTHKFYGQAEEKFLHALVLGSVPANYNLACLYSLTGNYKAAMHYIERSEAAGSLPDIDDLQHDTWLEGLRETDDFRQFITLLSQKRSFEY